MLPRLLAAALCAGLALPAQAQSAQAQSTPEASPPAVDAPPTPPSEPPPRPIRNAPSPRAMEFAAYIFAASNVCGYRIGTEEFEALLAKQNVKASDISGRGAFGGRVQTIFALMSNQMQQNREAACLAVAGEYGPEGSVARNVLLPAGVPDAPASPPAK